MRKALVAFLCVGAVVVTGVVGCASVNQQIREERARGTIESGGYTWYIEDDSQGGNTIKTFGLPSKSVSTTVSSMLCKKYDRIAQYVSQTPMDFMTVTRVTFNCVR